MLNLCSKLCVDISIFFGAYINKCQNGMVLNAQKISIFHSTTFIDSTTLTLS